MATGAGTGTATTGVELEEVERDEELAELEEMELDEEPLPEDELEEEEEEEEELNPAFSYLRSFDSSASNSFARLRRVRRSAPFCRRGGG
jgi:hypothetical protein